MSKSNHNSLADLIRAGVESGQARMMITLPGKVVAFTAGTQMAQVECGIQKRVNGKFQTIPVISNVRVQFSGDNEWYFWHQIKPGTEGLIHFAQRAIDTWLDQGGPVAPHEMRMFSAEDAFFVPGIRSAPRLIPNFVNEGVGLSSYDGATRVHLTPGVIDMTATTINLNADTINQTSTSHNVATGTLTENSTTHSLTSGALTITAVTAIAGDTGIAGALMNNGVNMGSTHTHSQGADSAGNTQVDTGPPK